MKAWVIKSKCGHGYWDDIGETFNPLNQATLWPTRKLAKLEGLVNLHYQSDYLNTEYKFVRVEIKEIK